MNCQKRKYIKKITKQKHLYFEVRFTYNSVNASMLLSSFGISPFTFLLDRFLRQVNIISKNEYSLNFQYIFTMEKCSTIVLHHVSALFFYANFWNSLLSYFCKLLGTRLIQRVAIHQIRSYDETEGSTRRYEMLHLGNSWRCIGTTVYPLPGSWNTWIPFSLQDNVRRQGANCINNICCKIKVWLEFCSFDACIKRSISFPIIC